MREKVMEPWVVEVVVFVALYGGLTIGVVCGWVSWAKRPEWRSLCWLSSLFSFALATTSFLLSAATITYAQAFKGFAYYDPVLLKIFRWGAGLSLLGVIFGMAGIWRRGPLRWFAPVCAFAMLVYWWMMAALE
jgi:hypothetical protein